MAGCLGRPKSAVNRMNGLNRMPNGNHVVMSDNPILRPLEIGVTNRIRTD